MSLEKKALPEEAVKHDEKEATHGQKKADTHGIMAGHAAHAIGHERAAKNGGHPWAQNEISREQEMFPRPFSI